MDNAAPRPKLLLEFDVGDVFTGFFVLKSKEMRFRKNGAPYVVIEIGDKSGRLKGNIWDEATDIFPRLPVDEVVKVQAQLETYQNTRQITVRQIRAARSDDRFDLSLLIAVTEIDVEKALARMLALIDRFQDQHLQRLLRDILTDESIRTQYLRAPAGKLWHHNRIGGLIEHTLGVVRLCRVMTRLYPRLNRDLLLSGAILHDIGKIEELRYRYAIDYTDRGRLVGHIVLGTRIIFEKTAQIEGFPPETRDQLLHLVLSHQGEFGTPVQPATPEAFALYYADELDSKMDAFERIKKKLPEGEKWTWVNLLNRWMTFGEKDPPEDFDSQEQKSTNPD